MATIVKFTYAIPGTIGNAATLAESSAALTASGATFTGGIDYPTATPPVLQAGVENFTVVGDQWQPDKTSALQAASDLVTSEWGWFYCQLDGTLTFKNRNFLPTAITNAVVINVTGEATLTGSEDISQVFNRTQITFTPRSQLTSGVMAQTSSPLLVPGQSGVVRWNGTVSLPGGGSVVVTLPFQDQTTKRPMGGKSIITPLVPTTDWTANEQSDSSGVSYTGNANLTFSLVRNSSNVEVSIKNTALGPLYVTMLKVRGTGYVSYDSQTFEAEDAASEALYGKRSLAISLPMPVSANFPPALGNYLLERYKDPVYRVQTIAFQHRYDVQSTALLGLRIGDVIKLTDAQVGLSNNYYLITAIQYRFKLGGVQNGLNSGSFTFNVIQLDDTPYGVWDSATLGLWDTAHWSL